MKWNAPLDITRQTKKPSWMWYAAGPCHAVLLKSGRIAVGCNHTLLRRPCENAAYLSHVIFSDDHGEHWHIGRDIGINNNERTLAQRSDSFKRKNLALHTSEDGFSWKRNRIIQPGFAAYSDITQIDEERFAVVYETGEHSPYERIAYTSISIGGETL